MECQKHNEYRESICWLLEYIREFSLASNTTAEARGGQTSSFTKVISYF